MNKQTRYSPEIRERAVRRAILCCGCEQQVYMMIRHQAPGVKAALVSCSPLLV